MLTEGRTETRYDVEGGGEQKRYSEASEFKVSNTQTGQGRGKGCWGITSDRTNAHRDEFLDAWMFRWCVDLWVAEVISHQDSDTFTKATVIIGGEDKKAQIGRGGAA